MKPTNEMTPEELEAKIDEILKSVQQGQQALAQTTQKKGSQKMAKMTKQTLALMKWREEHTGKDGKVVIKRRSPKEILAELKQKRKFYQDRIDAIDKKIVFYDKRLNADRRKELLSMVTTEQLAALVESLKK